MKHTKGKWFVNYNGFDKSVRTDKEFVTGIIFGKENANLISAAPDMRRSLHSLLNFLLESKSTAPLDQNRLKKILKIAEKALRKSKGL